MGAITYACPGYMLLALKSSVYGNASCITLAVYTERINVERLCS